MIIAIPLICLYLFILWIFHYRLSLFPSCEVHASSVVPVVTCSLEPCGIFYPCLFNLTEIWAEDTSSIACRERLYSRSHLFLCIGLQVPLPTLFTHTPRVRMFIFLAVILCHFLLSLHPSCCKSTPAFQENVIPEAVSCRYEGIRPTFFSGILCYTWNNVWNSLAKTVEDIIFKDRCF